MCGEKFDNPKIDNSQLGLPPRMRGKGGIHLRLPEGDGITPAYAGKSRKQQQAQTPRQDHPRMCGEKLEPS